ncbi:MAG: mechanosensitive ion channel [Halobacteriovoraceae bacterium]|nr:mechanosensitive ion channel [Halobacteriovoraceae bacterium]MCB9094151.1 mechanosensitive ion channel [Halobacteriovoraceae bacterium]
MPSAKEFQNLNDVLALFEVNKILSLIVGFTILIFVAKKVRTFSVDIQNRWPNLRLAILQVSTVLTFTWYILGSIALIYGIMKPSKEVLLALGGSAAVAIGFSLKDIVASIIAGIVLLFDRPFQVGDRVQFGEVYGEIIQIGLRAVRLVTLEDSVVTIPNSQFINNYVSSSNSGALDMMVVAQFHLSIEVKIDRVREILREIVITSRYAYLKKPVTILVKEKDLGNGSICLFFTVKAYVFDIQYEKAFETDIVTRAYEEFAKNSIERPFSHVRLNKIT